MRIVLAGCMTVLVTCAFILWFASAGADLLHAGIGRQAEVLAQY